MKSKECPICGGKGTVKRGFKNFSARYALTEYVAKIPVDVCSVCGAKFDSGKQSDKLKKEALIQARNNCVSETLSIIEKEMSFSDIERSFQLPARTLSKWKNQSKASSAAAAALVSLLGVFPWLVYVGMANFNPLLAYKIAGAAFFSKATEDEKIKAFFSSNESYDVMGLINDKSNVNKTVELVSSSNNSRALLAGGEYDY